MLCDDALMVPLHFQRPQPAKAGFRFDRLHLCPLARLLNVIEGIEDFSIENAQTEIKGWITSKEIGFGKVMQPLRLSLVGKLAGPDLFEIMTMIGKETTIKRIQNAISNLS